MEAPPQTVTELRERLDDRHRECFSLDGERRDETLVIEHRGAGWLVFHWERGKKRDFVKHPTEAAACHDAWARHHQVTN
jgi:hypothetical protein